MKYNSSDLKTAHVKQNEEEKRILKMNIYLW